MFLFILTCPNLKKRVPVLICCVVFRVSLKSGVTLSTSHRIGFEIGVAVVVVNADDVVSVAEVAVVDAVLALVVDCKKDKNL